MSQVLDDTCPLCDQKWPDTESLKAHLEEKLKRSHAAAEVKRRVLENSAKVALSLGTVKRAAETVGESAVSLELTAVSEMLAGWREQLVSLSTSLTTFEGSLSEYVRIRDGLLCMPAELPAQLTTLLAKVDEQAEPSLTDDANVFLALAQDRLDALAAARSKASRELANREAAEAIYQRYCKVQDAKLTALYEEVEQTFSGFYREINPDDEATFEAKFAPSEGKLDLTVDFHGYGMAPPNAFHSDGHQDGMGICLYLALIKRILGDEFLVVLDDVVMSVDAGHRREFCSLLIRHFPKAQFIITTHDELWAKQMVKANLVTRNHQARFHGWSVKQGPAIEDGTDFWDKIEASLALDNVEDAAACLRRNLEAALGNLTADMNGLVPYDSDGQYELGHFLKALKSRHKALLKKATASAKSYGRADDEAKIASLETARVQAVIATDQNHWIVNMAVHHNDWVTLSKSDFTGLVEAWKEFLSLFDCDNDLCHSGLFVTMDEMDEDSLKCRCGGYNLNLRKAVAV